jgi:hypothetical protein
VTFGAKQDGVHKIFPVIKELRRTYHFIIILLFTTLNHVHGLNKTGAHHRSLQRRDFVFTSVFPALQLEKLPKKIRMVQNAVALTTPQLVRT